MSDSNQKLWAIKLPFFDSWLYLTKHNPNGDIAKGTDIEIHTFESYEQAEQFVQGWKAYEVVPYSPDNQL